MSKMSKYGLLHNLLMHTTVPCDGKPSGFCLVAVFGMLEAHCVPDCLYDEYDDYVTNL